MEQYQIPDFKEHLIEGLSGKTIKLYHFTAAQYPAHGFRITFTKGRTGTKIVAHNKSLITVTPTYNCKDGNLNWCQPVMIDPDCNLYIKIEKRTSNPIKETELPMTLSYNILWIIIVEAVDYFLPCFAHFSKIFSYPLIYV